MIGEAAGAPSGAPTKLAGREAAGAPSGARPRAAQDLGAPFNSIGGVAAGQFITVNLRDHGRVNCGFRSFLVLQVGRKWIRLLYPPTLTPLRVAADELADARPEAAPPSRLRARLRHLAARHHRLGLPFNRDLVREALALLDAPLSAPRGAARRRGPLL